MNKAILIGRLTREPDLKTTMNATSVCSFTLAVNRRYKNAEGNYDADFINCVAWRGTAEYLAKNYGKGDMLGVVGSIQTRNYEKDGTKVYITEVIADEVHYVGGRKSADNPSTADAVPLPLHKGGRTPSEDTAFDGLPLPADEDLPF